MTTTTETRTEQTLTVHAIDPVRLDAVREAGVDHLGNPFTPFPATGAGEPLRCCLRFAREGEQIALISFAPFSEMSVWREVGPVYVHAEHCEGYAERWLPSDLRRGQMLLRTYHADGSMDYEHNTVVMDEDVEPVLAELLAEPDVALVHVRTLRPQCFLYAVTR